MDDKWFVNLTSGIEGVKVLGLESYQFVRIRSTAVQLGMYADVIRDLDYNFLMALAIGHRVIVVDASGREMSDAMRVAVPWIRYTLDRRWYGIITNEPIFDGHYNYPLMVSALAKVNYIKPFACGTSVQLEAVMVETRHDDEVSYYARILGGQGEEYGASHLDGDGC